MLNCLFLLKINFYSEDYCMGHYYHNKSVFFPSFLQRIKFSSFLNFHCYFTSQKWIVFQTLVKNYTVLVKNITVTDMNLGYACSANEGTRFSFDGGRSERAREKKGEKIDSGGAVIWGKHENVKRLRELKQVADKNTQG